VNTGGPDPSWYAASDVAYHDGCVAESPEQDHQPFLVLSMASTSLSDWPFLRNGIDRVSCDSELIPKRLESGYWKWDGLWYRLEPNESNLERLKCPPVKAPRDFIAVPP
jgi:hypothetical protein